MVEEKKPDMRFIEWREKLKKKVGDFFHRLTHTYDLANETPEQKSKLELLYNKMMEDIVASEAPEEIKEGLDPLPVMMGYLLSAAGGGAIAMIMGSLLTPYIQSKLTYAMNKQAVPYRFDPAVITRLWLRGFPDEIKKEDWWKDLQDQGWNEERIAAAKELAMLLPTPSDLITWQAREVFEPDAIEKYGLADEFEKLDLTLFEKVGISEEMAKNYWMAHWQHASWTQVVEMLHRGLMTEEDVWEWFRLVEIPPYWREKLIAMSWNIPTRVDVRRWWDMRTITEADLREIYTRQGYHGKDLEDYITWTKVYTDLPDLIARYKNGWINLGDVKARLLEDGMPEARMEEILETKFKQTVAQERVAETTALTRALIIKGAKEGKLTKEQTIDLLIRKNYDEWEAEYIYAVEVEAAASPETYLEFKQLVESYRRSQGMSTVEIPREVIELEKRLLGIEKRLKEAKAKGEREAKINELEVARAELAVKYREALIGTGL